MHINYNMCIKKQVDIPIPKNQVQQNYTICMIIVYSVMMQY